MLRQNPSQTSLCWTLHWNDLICKIRLYKYYPYVGYWWSTSAHGDGGLCQGTCFMTQNEVTASLPPLSGTLFSFTLSWLRSGSGVVNEQCLTVCFICAVYRERLPLAAGSWHTLHLPPAKSEWNHTQGDGTERTRSTRLVITFKWDKILFLSQRKKGTWLIRFSI